MNAITFEEDMTKAELLEIVKRNKPEPTYIADRFLHEHGHTVLRLPPYHCDLSPIEYVWGLVKQKLQKLEAEYREKDELIEEEVVRFVINLSEDSSSNSSESDSDMSGICPL
ncbi:hypothetical protein ANN_21460 [Periplaneta americana]|uniref:Tc1-like transposase DDE domain-containing protein n=1 Tax=Periplaneta americana TaxID=6978 RepID=A0ABQ8SFC3_PERAM|nr:hypothetical protein ANN_21460 [Periplaneta americana]